MVSFKSFITELTNVKKYYGATSLKNLFKKLKWREIGEGAHALVFDIPNKPYIIKVWTLDEGYEGYLKFILKDNKHIHNPHLPKTVGRMKSIPAFHVRAKKDQVLKIVKIEKLEELPTELEYFVDELVFEIEDEHYLNREVNKSRRNLDLFPQGTTLKQTLRDIVTSVPDRARIDLHMGNFMYRPSDGMVVCIDPYHIPEEVYDIDEWIIDDNNPALAKYTKPKHLEKTQEQEDEELYQDFEDMVNAV